MRPRTTALALAAIAYFGGITTDTAAAARYRAADDGSVTITWPGRTCELDDLDIDTGADSWSPQPAEDLGEDPTIDIPGGEPAADPGPLDSDAWPTFELRPWRARYYPDGSWEAWHDDRCAGYADVAMVYLDPDTGALARAERIAHKAKHAPTTARRRSHA